LKLVYKGEEPLRMLVPVDKLFMKDDTVEVTDEFASQLKDLGFEEIKETKKEGDK
jgi:hypothetical protein